METITTILPLPYFGNIYFYSHFLRDENILLEAHENYPKQTYRNRTEIGTANGILPLTVPVQKAETVKQLYTNIKIDYKTNWQKIHFKALESAYNHTPFFEFYIDDFMHFFTQKHEYLFQLNTDIHKIVLDILRIKTEIRFTPEFYPNGTPGYEIRRDNIHPKEETWKNDSNFYVVPYFQLFNSRFGFVPNLSILDLIFNEGPDANFILLKTLGK